MIVACSEGHKDIVKVLLEHNADDYLQANDGVAALHLVCISRNLDIATMLIHKQADVNVCNVDGVTPLMAACEINIKTL